MAVYPDLPLSKDSKRTATNGTVVDQADDGTPWLRDFYATNVYRFEVTHPLISAGEAGVIEAFYEANRDQQVSFTYKKDGNVYDCYFTGPVQIDSSGQWFEAKAQLIGTTWTPARLLKGQTGLLYDVQNLATLFTDETGSTQAQVGDGVGKILDLSGGGYDAVQSTASLRPILRQDSNGKYYLEFNGNGQYLSIPGLATSVGDHSAAFAINSSAPPPTSSGERWLFDSEAGRLVFGERSGEGGAPTLPQEIAFFDGAWRKLGTPVDTPQILTFVLSGTSGSAYTNGVFIGSDTYTPKGIGGSVSLGGDYSGGSSQSFEGDMYAFFILDKSITSAERNNLKGWMSSRSGFASS